MGFNQEWFDSLASVTEEIIERIPTPPGRAPAIEDRSDLEDISPLEDDFLDPLAEMVRHLHGSGHTLSTRFRMEHQHVYTYPRGKSYKCQKNIGFWARDTRKIRIGRGLRVHNSPTDDHDRPADFIEPILKSPQQFDLLYERLGSYHEPDAPSNYREEVERPSEYFTKRVGNMGWMFFGACLHRDDPAHRWIMEKPERVGNFAAEVFDVIEESPFSQ